MAFHCFATVQTVAANGFGIPPGPYRIDEHQRGQADSAIRLAMEPSTVTLFAASLIALGRPKASERHCHVCGRPRERKQNLSECMASQVGSDVCPASDATEQSRARMGVRRSGPNR